MKKQEENGSRKRLSKKSIKISIAVIAAAAVILISAAAALRERDTVRIEESVYTYINGMKISWPEGAVLTKRDGRVYMKGKTGRQAVEEYPLLWEEAPEILLQKSCSWNSTVNDDIYRADYYTKITKAEDGIHVSRRKNEVLNPGGFLYDNSNTYVFLEKVDLKWGEKEVRIEPGTVVQVSYGQYIQIYRQGMEVIYDTEGTEEVIALTDTGRTINLSTDTYYMETGAWRLLFTPLDIFEDLQSGGVAQ